MKRTRCLRKKRGKTNANSCQQSSVTIEALFTDAIAKVKAEAAEVIAKVKAEAEETIAKIKAEHEQQIAKVKSETEEAIAKEKTRADEATEQTAEIKAEAEQAIAKQKAMSEAEESIAKIKAEYEQQIARVKTEAEEEIAKVKVQAEEMIAEQKARLEAETTEQIAKAETEAEENPAEQEAKSESEVDEAAVNVEADAGEEIDNTNTETEEKVQETKPASEEKVGEKVKAKAEEEAKAEHAEQETDDADTDASDSAVEEKAVTTTESKESAAGRVSETIQRMAQSPAGLPGEHSLPALKLCARDIMQRELIWGNPDDSVQQTLAKMQQHDVGYMLIGQDGVLEGIVSKSDLKGAISPYLRPEFAKWRRPLDDATLQIRVKWIMSKPVHIISPQTSLAAIMKNMCQFRVQCLPVVDRQGKVQGLVTEADIFKAILKPKSDPNTLTPDEEHQLQPVSPQTPESTSTQPAETGQPSVVSA